jgi:curli production assembly/transport component CsgG
MKILFGLITFLFLSSCTSVIDRIVPSDPEVVKPIVKEFNNLAPPRDGPIVVAVYGFEDKTGQRKPSDRLAHISTAVTQGAEVWVIKALQEVGNGKWFKVVERVGLENLSRERQIIRQTRESVNDPTPVAPMMFAGVLIEGAVVGYDSNTLTGGAGARYLGVGPSTQYREDVVTVTMRAVSVQTGEVLVSVATTKTIVSTSTNLGIFKFIEMGTENVEFEVGNSQNEPVNYAVRMAIEQAVVEIIKEGATKKYWAFKR